MGDDRDMGIQKYEVDAKLPAGFERLPEHEQLEVLRRLSNDEVAILRTIKEKAGKSRVAEHDLNVAISAVERLEQERKVYSQHTKAETGSGTIEQTIRGGDTRFIVPILIVVGVVVLGVVAILALR